jgi:AraC family transcriptional regulator, arabinose operon regulatory protein
LTPVAAPADGGATPGPPDILFAGHHRWKPRPWSRPELPGTWLLTYTSAGQGGYRSGAVQITPGPGDVVLVHRSAPVEHCAPGPSTWEHSYLRFDPWPGWQPPAPFGRVTEGLYRAHVRFAPTRQRVEDALRRLIADVRSRDAARALVGLRPKSASARGQGAEGLRELALTALREVFLLIGEDPLESGRLDPRIAGVLQVLTDDLAGPHDIASLARTAGLSESRFWHLFREQVGVPPQRAIRSLRLQQSALRLTYTSDAVGAIADETGFSSIYDFSRQFRRAYGVSPRAYRARFRTPELPPATPPRRSVRSRPARHRD